VPPRPADTATLKVVNRTSALVRVEADRRSLGEVPAGREQYFVGLAPGTVDLTGISLDGALSFRRDLLALEPGETFTWILREAEAVPAAEQPAAGGQQTASLIVENGTDWDVDVVLDGQVLGRTSAGRTARFDGLASGAHRLEARAPETTFPQEFPVLESGETFTWRLRGPGPISARGLLPAPGTGRLRVENPNAETVTVQVNGVVLGRVDARNTRIFDNLAAGSMQLSAESLDGLTRYEGPALTIEPGRVALWRLGPGLPADLAAGRGERAPAPAPEGPVTPSPAPAPGPEPSLPAPGTPAPEPAPSAPAPGGPAVEPAPAPEDQGLETPEPAVAGKAFVVENQTSQDLEIQIDGQSVGAVGAGMTRTFTDLPRLRFIPSAISANGARRFEHPEVDLTGQDTFNWIIQP
jgi:hypothetical protein